MVYIPSPESGVDLCSGDPESTAEVAVPGFRGTVRKIHAASTLDFWNASHRTLPLGTQATGKEMPKPRGEAIIVPAEPNVCVILAEAPDV